MGVPNKPMPPEPGSISFSQLITNYLVLQSQLVQAIDELAKNPSSITPGRFLLLQFQMARVTQVGESISNLIMQINAMCKGAVGNQARG